MARDIPPTLFDPDTRAELGGTRLHDRPAPIFLGTMFPCRARIVDDPRSGERVVAFAERPRRGARGSPLALTWKTTLLDSVERLRKGDEKFVRRFVESFGALEVGAYDPEKDALLKLQRLARAPAARHLRLEPVRCYRDTGERAFAILAAADCARRGVLPDILDVVFPLLRWVRLRNEDVVEAILDEPARRRREEDARAVFAAMFGEQTANDAVASTKTAEEEQLDVAIGFAVSRMAASIEVLGDYVASAINLWLEETRIAPTAVARDGAVRLELAGGSGAHAAVAFQVAAKACARSYALCAGCSMLFEVETRATGERLRGRAPQWGRRAFCEPCRENGVPQEFADLGARERRRTGAAPRWRRKTR